MTRPTSRAADWSGFRSILLVLVLLIAYLPSQAQISWTWKNPYPQGNQLNSVQLLDSLTAFAVGEAGTIMRTTNGGLLWTVSQHTTPLRTIYDVRFILPDTAYLAGDDEDGIGLILRSTDGGSSWVTLNTGTISILRKMFFLDARHGWVVGSGGTVIATTNAGIQWTVQNSNTFDDLTGVWFKNLTFGYATGENGKIVVTGDGGASWSSVSTGTGKSFNALSGFPLGVFIAVGDSGMIFRKSEEGGWSFIPSNTLNNLHSIATTGWTEAIAAGENGVALRSTDYGLSWSPASSGTTDDILSLSILKSGHGAGVGQKGDILWTADTGQTWSSQSTGFRTTLRGVSFRDSLRGTVVSSTGLFYATTDGGSTWSVDSTWVGNALNAIEFADQSVGVAVGGSGLVLRSTDGGTIWAPVTSNTSSTLYRVSFADSLHGMISGAGGRILQSTDGGASWDTLSSTTTTPLRAISHVSPDRAIAVGLSGIILRTTDAGSTWNGITLRTLDGGNTWGTQPSGVTTALFEVSFADSLHGVATGAPLGAELPPILFHTTDGGDSWNGQVAPSGIGLVNAVSWKTNTIAVGVGSDGMALRTSDAGASWSTIPPPANQVMYDMTMISPGAGIIVGSGGVILRTTDGGISWREPATNQVVPDLPSLSQNYPNPFNPTTTIEFATPVRGRVMLTVYDLTGRIIAIPFHDIAEAGNRYVVRFDASGLSSGLYFYTLSAGPHRLTRKMVLIR